MRENRMKKYLGIMALSSATLIVCATGQAAGPVAVSPTKSGEVVVAQPSEYPVTFTLGVGAGYLTGDSTEIVYWPELNNHKASELTWNIDNLYMVGVSASLAVSDWFVANFEGWFNATDGDGSMDDYDWLVVGADWSDWSTHDDTDVTEGSIIDLNANFAFYRNQNVKFTGIIGYKRDKFGWDAKGGDYVYSINGFRDSSGSFQDGLLGISYEQEMSSLYGGLGFEAHFSGNFTLSGRVIYSPFVEGEAVDHHHIRNLVTYDDFDDGDLIGFDISGRYLFYQCLAMEVMFSYQDYDTMQGDSEWHFNDEGVILNLKDGAGMDHSSAMISVALQYTF